MKHISVLIKPASSLCNLRCKYCFYANVSSLREVRSYGKMKSEVAKKMIENIFVDLEEGDKLSLAFQGGEPTLAGLEYFKKIVYFVNIQEKKVEVNYSIQTNGTLINSLWCEFLQTNGFLVGLSIDGSSKYHDSNRIDQRGKGSFHKVLQAKKLFDKYNIDYNVLCVLTDQLAVEPKEIFNFIQEQDIKYIQFIPCLDDLDSKKRGQYALKPMDFSLFYMELLSLWLRELELGNYISIKLFDDIVNLFVKHQITACGMLGNCQVQYVIEADGSVYPCDFYVLDEYRMGYIQEESLQELFNKKSTKAFLCSRPETSLKCQSCPFQNVCHGGCSRMGDAMYVDESENICGYQELLYQFIPKISGILEHVKKLLV